MPSPSRTRPERIDAAAKVIAAIDKARPEVVIDVELLEVDRTKLTRMGLEFALAGSARVGIYGAADVNRRQLLAPAASQPDARRTCCWPACRRCAPAAEATTATRARWPIRSCAPSEGLPAQAKFGERVPVPVTTFAARCGWWCTQQPITSFNYENIGVNLDITPRTHHNDGSLALKIEVRAFLARMPRACRRSGTARSATVDQAEGRRNQYAGRPDSRR